tara:strand:+ start:2470 stop:3594 length:1125 start_codon:yes stop_codon:yes gene_type:complete
MKKNRILFVITEDWALISHRLHLVNAAINAGHVVGLATRINNHRELLKSHGIKLFEWNLERRSLNPLREIMMIINLCRIIWIFRPNIIHAVAQKPVLYASIARKFFNKAGFIGTLGGLGFIFTSKSFKARLLKRAVKLFLKFALMGKKTLLILQNKDNIETIKSLGVINNKNIRLVRGAGVETEKFVSKPIPKGIPIIILPGRMLWDKGVGEFFRLAKRIKAKKIKARFVLVGDIDSHNPLSLSQLQIDKWVNSGVIEQWKRCDKMELVYQQALIVCLPSYNEGLPKVLLEAGSCSRPIVTFDVPGCREVVKNNVNGYLIEFGNELALEDAIINLINDKNLCKKMGEQGRKIAKTQFSSKIINTQTFKIWNEVI